MQGHLDGAEEIYMIPAYPLMYFYPHWQDWKKEYRDEWNWNRIINVFCEKHASVIDSRRIPGFNGMQNLGKSKNEYVAVDEQLFRLTLSHLLANEPIKSSTFLLAVHYAYSICRGEDITKKHLLIYHIHAHDYLSYLLADFPNLIIVAMTRDPRSNLQRRIETCYNVDAGKLNKSDTYIFRALPVYNTIRYILQDNQIIASTVAADRIRIVRHEDLGLRLEDTLRSLCVWLGLKYSADMLDITFGEKEWWGDAVYNMAKTNRFNPRVLSKDWQLSKSTIEWYIEEGLMLDFFVKYGYVVEKYKTDSFPSRIFIVLLSIIPSKNEVGLLLFFLNPKNILSFILASWQEATGSLPIKDYTWNATYLYKWMYFELRLWETRLHVQVMTKLKYYALHSNIKLFKNMLNIGAISLYVLGQCVRYVFAIIKLPYWYLRTRKVMAQRMIERWRGKALLPESL